MFLIEAAGSTSTAFLTRIGPSAQATSISIPIVMPPQDTKEFIKDDVDLFQKIIEEGNLQVK